MLSIAAAQCRQQVEFVRGLTRGLDDSHRALTAHAGGKTGGWLLGHIAVTGDYARKLCGRPPICPVAWRALFSPGTIPSTTASDYPAMDELRDAVIAVYSDLADAAPALGADAQAAPNRFTPVAREFPTTGEFVTYLMTGHIAYHLGQLQAWRAACVGDAAAPQPAASG
jgi:hypothetical protein